MPSRLCRLFRYVHIVIGRPRAGRVDYFHTKAMNDKGVHARVPGLRARTRRKVKYELPTIFKAVIDAAQSAGRETGKPVRVWMLGGMGVLNYPGTDTALSN